MNQNEHSHTTRLLVCKRLKGGGGGGLESERTGRKTRLRRERYTNHRFSCWGCGDYRVAIRVAWRIFHLPAQELTWAARILGRKGRAARGRFQMPNRVEDLPSCCQEKGRPSNK